MLRQLGGVSPPPNLVSLNAQLSPWAEYPNAYTILLRSAATRPYPSKPQIQLITKFSQWLRTGHIEVYALDEIIAEPIFAA
jgi:hypothetical protein